MSNLLEKIASMPQPSLIQHLHTQPPVTPDDNQAPVAPAQNQPPVTSDDNQAPVAPAPAPAQIQLQAPPSETPDPSKPAIPQEFMYKNYLQEFTQREGLPLPLYQTVFEGISHPQMFRSTVVVNGTSYTSPNIFPTRKAAEMNVARIALLNVHVLPQVQECSIGQEELILCKAILKEYADKINVENPIYKTERGDVSCLTFTSSVTFNGTQYVGEQGKNKKESQHLAARAAILAISGSDSDACGVISKIIKSKRRTLFPAKGTVNSPCNGQNVGMPAGIQTISSVVTCARKENELRVVNDNMVKTATQEPCTGNSSSASAEPVSLVGASATLNLEQLIVGSTSSKKRKRKTKKAEKKVESDAQAQVAAVPPSQNTASTDYSGQICAPNSCVSQPGSGNAVLSQT